MLPQLDVSTHDLSRTRLRLPDELVVTPQQYAGNTFYHLELPSRGRFYRIGYAEYVFISLLDGNTTFAQALTLTARALGADAFTQTQAQAIYTWLIDSGIASLSGTRDTEDTGSDSPVQTASRTLNRFNPFWIKIPLLRPQRLLDHLTPMFGGIFSIPMTIAGLLVIAFALTVLSSDWERFTASSRLILTPSNWWQMFVVWVVLKVVHEFAHAIVCRRYGGKVREMGAVLILLAPLAYVDVTSSWRFRSAWQRIHTAAAGMFLEVLIAAIAVLIWSRTHDDVVAHVLYNVIVMAGVSTVLFNANPLMRFDGYYILSDLLQIPNLYARGSDDVQRLAQRVYFGRSASGPKIIGWRGSVIRVYGLAAFIWRLVVCASLLIAASTLFHGAGVILAAFGVLAWCVRPLTQLAVFLSQQRSANPAVFLRALGAGVLTVAGVAGIALYVPWPGALQAPGVIDYSDQAIVRCSVSGFLRTLHVTDGLLVEPGDLLVELDNEELAMELVDLQSRIEQSRVRERIHQQAGELATVQIEQRSRQALAERLAERQRQFDGLTIRAPVAGRIVARTLSSRIMTWLKEGDEILTIGNDNGKEFVVSIDQADVDQIAPRVGTNVNIRVAGTGRLRGMLDRVEPAARTKLPHPALAASVGGPVAVRPQEPDDDKNDDHSNSGSECVTPRFKGIVSLGPDSRHLALSGQRGTASFGLDSRSIGHVLYRGAQSWLHEQLRTAEHAAGAGH